MRVAVHGICWSWRRGIRVLSVISVVGRRIEEGVYLEHCASWSMLVVAELCTLS